MAIRLTTILVLLASSINAYTGDAGSIQLIPQEGSHQFPFFEKPTPVLSYNQQVPGPTIRGKEGSTLSVEVFNRLKESTTVHWHGLRIDNAMDGVPGVTQDPIKPGGRFTYRLKLNEAGTFWYHPHFNAGEQLERGLKGVLIVEESEKLPWSQDLIWLIDDMVRAVREDRAPYITGESARRAVDLILAIYASSRTGVDVAVADVRDLD